MRPVMNNKSSSSSSGTGFLGLLTIVFITLKLLGKITWAWKWVLAPIWIPVAFLLVVLVDFVILALVGLSAKED